MNIAHDTPGFPWLGIKIVAYYDMNLLILQSMYLTMLLWKRIKSLKTANECKIYVKLYLKERNNVIILRLEKKLLRCGNILISLPHNCADVASMVLYYGYP